MYINLYAILLFGRGQRQKHRRRQSLREQSVTFFNVKETIGPPPSWHAVDCRYTMNSPDLKRLCRLVPNTESRLCSRMSFGTLFANSFKYGNHLDNEFNLPAILSPRSRLLPVPIQCTHSAPVFSRAAAKASCRSKTLNKMEKYVRRRILVVDEEWDMGIFIKTVLEGSGFDAVFATTSQTALESARAGKPELIIMDIMISAQSGESLYISFKRDPILRDIPILILSTVSHRTQSHYWKIMSDYCNFTLPAPKAHLQRPPESKKLLEYVKKILN